MASNLIIKYASMAGTGNSTIYVGKAASGTADDAAAWQIKRVEQDAGDADVEWCDGNADFDNVWIGVGFDSYLFHSYS